VLMMLCDCASSLSTTKQRIMETIKRETHKTVVGCFMTLKEFLFLDYLDRRFFQNLPTILKSNVNTIEELMMDRKFSEKKQKIPKNQLVEMEKLKITLEEREDTIFNEIRWCRKYCFKLANWNETSALRKRISRQLIAKSSKNDEKNKSKNNKSKKL